MKIKSNMIVCLFGIVLSMNLTVCAQSDSRTICDKIHYTDEMDKACQECWENHANRNEIVKELTIQNQYRDSLYNIVVYENKAISDSLAVARLDIIKQQKKVRRNRRIAISGFSGFLASLIILFTFG